MQGLKGKELAADMGVLLLATTGSTNATPLTTSRPASMTASSVVTAPGSAVEINGGTTPESGYLGNYPASITLILPF